MSNDQFIKVVEQVGMCLYILSRGASHQETIERFQHSISTISKYFSEVFEALVTLSVDVIRPDDSLDEVPLEISNNGCYLPLFSALDGTHIQAIVSDKDGTPCRNHKGEKTCNVLGVFSLDIMFTFINASWEGSVHDVTVWRHCLENSEYKLSHPPPSMSL
ncbi:hypothetical protein Cgig2_027255 [Carnegiea gigantea]|uniref:DDE Tnp4 domain-containing protein n=1 Tax=Carnegiea gigantea TaxID=171969 RepID=A0A9Q1QB75_9CARY|nr:hypothetical protein Cgig2_027255 [Carnegiea gigantea]